MEQDELFFGLVNVSTRQTRITERDIDFSRISHRLVILCSATGSWAWTSPHPEVDDGENLPSFFLCFPQGTQPPSRGPG